MLNDEKVQIDRKQIECKKFNEKLDISKMWAAEQEDILKWWRQKKKNWLTKKKNRLLPCRAWGKAGALVTLRDWRRRLNMPKMI